MLEFQLSPRRLTTGISRRLHSNPTIPTCTLTQDTQLSPSPSFPSPPDVLVHYIPSLPVILESDAGQYGIGAVILHLFPNGYERPIAYASRSLNSSEKNYTCQLHIFCGGPYCSPRTNMKLNSSHLLKSPDLMPCPDYLCSAGRMPLSRPKSLRCQWSNYANTLFLSWKLHARLPEVQA